jgi:Glycogen debranching enzyme N terminal
MTDLVRRLPWRAGEGDEPKLLDQEWLVANGLGGYTAGTIAGAITRRYHGLLVAALPAPLGRLVLSHLWERVRLPDRTVFVLSGEERVGSLELAGTRYHPEFRPMRCGARHEAGVHPADGPPRSPRRVVRVGSETPR